MGRLVIYAPDVVLDFIKYKIGLKYEKKCHEVMIYGLNEVLDFFYIKYKLVLKYEYLTWSYDIWSK